MPCILLVHSRMDDPEPPTGARRPDSTSRRPVSERLSRRKRVVVACQFCRIRKTRCDGVKPVCGFCQRHEARCVWGTTSANDEHAMESTPTEREILSRLDEIKSLLDANAPSPRQPPTVRPPSSSEERSCEPPPSTLPGTSAIPPSHPAIRCESILRWPVFHGLIEPSDAAIESFVFECAPVSSDTDNGASSAIIQEHSLLPLCRKFLAHVHARNPILEGSELIHYAKHVTENGLAWDGRSCLVVCPIPLDGFLLLITALAHCIRTCMLHGPMGGHGDTGECGRYSICRSLLHSSQETIGLTRLLSC